MTLNPCPFCGASTSKVEKYASGGRAIACITCGATSGSARFEEGAIDKWQRRTGAPPEQPSTLRDDIARDGLRATLPHLMESTLAPEALDATARFSYALADAMMKARS